MTVALTRLQDRPLATRVFLRLDVAFSQCTVRDQICPAVFLKGIITPHGLARGLLGCWTQEPATLLHGSRRVKVLAMHVFLCLVPAPCPCRALNNHLDGRRMSINCSNGEDRADAMCDLRTVGRVRPALHVHVDYPSVKEGGELTQACALSLSFTFTFFISTHTPVRYAVSILFVLVYMSGYYGAEPNCIPRVLNNQPDQRNNVERVTRLFPPTRGNMASGTKWHELAKLSSQCFVYRIPFDSRNSSPMACP